MASAYTEFSSHFCSIYSLLFLIVPLIIPLYPSFSSLTGFPLYSPQSSSLNLCVAAFHIVLNETYDYLSGYFKTIQQTHIFSCCTNYSCEPVNNTDDFDLLHFYSFQWCTASMEREAEERKSDHLDKRRRERRM